MVQWMLVHWYWFLFWKPAYYMVMWLVPTVLGKDGSVYFEEFKGWFKSLMGLVL